MEKLTLIASLVICFAVLSTSKTRLNAWGNYNFATFQCLKSRGYDSIILKLDSRQTYINSLDIQNIITARNAGFQVQPGLTPCRVKSPAIQAQRILKSFPQKVFNKVWAVPMDNDPICTWVIHDPRQNCQYLQQFILEMSKLGVDVGIAADRDSWLLSFGSIKGCPEVSSALLWWIPVDQEDDGKPDFSSYKQIGGWKTPYMKQFGSWTACGIYPDLNFYN